MKKNSEQSSFRNRKLIEEMAPQRRSEALANTTNDELSNIATNVKDAQAASEMAAEVFETKGNRILGEMQKQGAKLDDVVAGTEMAAEASEKTTEQVRKLNGVASAISDKLNKLSGMLQEKIQGPNSPVQGSVNSESTSLQAIKEAMPIEVEQPKLTELLEKMIPQHPIPEDAPFLPPPPQQQPEEKKDKDPSGGIKMDDLIKTTKSGFKATLNITDKIAGMLFKYTVSALASAAKLAGMIFSIVLGIDMVRVYFQWFMKKFDESWKKFDAKFEEWGPLIADLLTMAKNISTMFSEKNWAGLAKAIMTGIMDITETLGDLLFLGLSKVTASILRALGKDEAADNIEGGALQGFQQRTGAVLDDEDQTTLARYQDRKDQERVKSERELNDKFKDKPDALKQAVKYGTVGKETAEKITNKSFDFSFQEMPEEQRLAAFKKRNEAEAAAIRATDRATSIMRPDEADKKNMEEAKADVINQLNDPSIKAVPGSLDQKQLLNKFDEALEKFNKPTIKPAPVETKEEVQASERIQQAEKANAAAKQNSGQTPATFNQQNIVNKSSKTQYNMPPQSSTPAPGMRLSTQIN